MRRPALRLRSDQFEYVQLILLAVIVGVLAALGNLGFRKLIDFCSWLFREVEWNALGIERGGWHRAFIPLILMSGGVAVLLLDRIFPEDVLGYGFPNFLEMVNLGSARIKRQWIFVKAAGAAISLGAGASVGREGPIAQVGGAIGSTVAQLRKLSPDRAKAPVFDVPDFVLRSYWEMATYALMGAGLGVLAAGYIRFFNGTAAWFRRLDAPVWLKLEAGLAVVGVIAIWLPQNLSDGYPIINRAMAGEYELGLLLA